MVTGKSKIIIPPLDGRAPLHSPRARSFPSSVRITGRPGHQGIEKGGHSVSPRYCAGAEYLSRRAEGTQRTGGTGPEDALPTPRCEYHPKLPNIPAPPVAAVEENLHPRNWAKG